MNVTVVDLTVAADWVAVVVDLSSRLGPKATRRAAAMARRSRWSSPMLLAALVLAVPDHRRPMVVDEVVADAAPGLDRQTAGLLARWVEATAVGFVRTGIDDEEPGEVEEIPPAPIVESRGRLRLSPSVAALDLPLLDLAADIAQARPDGLRVAAGWLQSVCSGLWKPAAGLILLDFAALEHPRVVAEVFAHELGHVLDRDIGTTSPDEQERFADRLGGFLLTEEPATVADARPLIARARSFVRPLEYAGLPAAGHESLMVFAYLFQREAA